MRTGSALSQQELYGLSPQQARLWELQKRRPGSAYRVTGWMGTPGISADDLTRALRPLLSRHPELGARLCHPYGPDGRPMIALEKEVNCDFLRLDASGGRLTLTIPAMFVDGRSLKILARDLMLALAGRDLSEAPRYVDVAAWEQKLLESPDTESVCKFWADLRRFEQSTPLFDFGAGRWKARSRVSRVFEPHCLAGRIVLSLSGLRAVGSSLNISAPDLLLTAWHSLLLLLSRSETAVVGVAFDGRSYEGLEGGVGLYERFLPSLTLWDPVTPFATLARSVAAACAEAAEHQEYYPSAAPAGDFGFAYLFQCTDSDINLQSCYSVTEPFDLRLTALLTADEVHVDFDYDSEAYKEGDIARLASWYGTLLECALSSPDIPLGQLMIGEESAPLCGSASNPNHKAAETYHGAFEAQAFQTPSRIALVFGGQELTYGELNERSDRLAVVLQGLGAGPGTVTGIRVDRSPELVVGLLGILKAGGAYLPISRDLPRERKALMLAEAGVQVVVCNDANAHLEMPGVHVVSPSETATGPFRRHYSMPDAAYVLYTSGSTGRPKQVVISHRNLTHYVHWASSCYGLREGTGTLVQSSVSFDLTVTSLLAPLVVGQRVHLLAEDADIDDLAAAVVGSNDLTLLKLTPSQLSLLNRSLGHGALAGRVRTIVVGGEQLEWEHIALWLEHAPGTRIFNEYGPTEATVGCCAYEVFSTDPRAAAIPIGRPIHDTFIYLLDRRGKPIPQGLPGEICIGGLGVAAACLTRGPTPGEEVYHSGDAGRLLADGNLEYLGRLDAQLKISGFRIDPAEVEQALMRSAPLKQAVVIARHIGEGRTQLVAYVTGLGPLDCVQLRESCRAVLPSYMVPSEIIALLELPLSKNGKVDFHRLSSRGNTGHRVRVAPATIEEAALAKIWSAVLGKNGIGIDDNYFALGGDSINSLRIVSAAGKQGLAFTVADLLRYPTIRGLAKAAVAVSPRPEPVTEPFAMVSGKDIPRLPPGVEDAYPLSMLQIGMIFHNELDSGASRYHDIFSYRLRMPVAPDHLRISASLLVQEHPALRTTYDLVHFTEPLQLVHPRGEEMLEIEDLRGIAEPEQDQRILQWIQAEKQRSFNIACLPLVRLHAHLRCEDEVQLSISFHHAAIDGWSDVSLLTEFFAIYYASMRGERVEIHPPETHYRDFVAAEREATLDDGAKQYWAAKLDGASYVPLPRLASDDANGTSNSVVVRTVEVTDGLSEALKKLALNKALPVKSLLLAAHMRVQSLLSGQADVLSAMVVSGRPERPGGDRTIGLFINSVPVRMALTGGCWTDLANQAFREEVDAMPYRRFPLSEIRKIMGGPVSESLFYFTHYHIIDRLPPTSRPEILQMIPHESSSFPLVANFWIDPIDDRVKLNLAFHANVFSAAQMEEIAGYYQRALEALANWPDGLYESAELLSEQERLKLLIGWNRTNTPVDYAPIHEQIRARAMETPTAVAAVFENHQLSYAGLEACARGLAAALAQMGAGPSSRVAILAPRGVEMLWAILAIWKTGAAYIPVDPMLPKARQQMLLLRSGAGILVSRRDLVSGLDTSGLLICDLDASPTGVEPPAVAIGSHSPAYLMYTSGSTGKPQGVIVTHGNLAQFLVAMDQTLGSERGVWLAVTNYAFDISILELFWTLARGWKVVIQGLPESYFGRRIAYRHRNPAFSLYYFPAEDAAGYRLLLDGSRFADRCGFEAVWMPERHFHDFGGPFPNPAVTAAAVAAITSRIGIRAGSVVLPLHHPVRVAEEWAMVDNLSGGRVGLSFASGWHARDFVLAPEAFEDRKGRMFCNIDVVRRLWRGETISLPDGKGAEIEIRVYPKPVNRELPVWISTTGSLSTIRLAASAEANLLTHLLGQNLGELRDRITSFRNCCAHERKVTLMVHTFVGENADSVQAIVREPFLSYLGRSVDLVDNLYGEILTGDSAQRGLDQTELLERTFQRYRVSGALFGSTEQCLEAAVGLAEAGVDEIACLIDFGIRPDLVMSGLERLEQIRTRLSGVSPPDEDRSIAGEIRRHGVTHLQCTPTLASALQADVSSASALGMLKVLLVGGEPLPAALAARLTGLTRGRILNMYGPTETTIWSTTAEIGTDGRVTIGRPLPNTRVYILDQLGKPVPVGVTGELYIGGSGVTSGYLDDPQLTSQRFVPDLVYPASGAVCYRTSDLCRFLPDGRIEFLGRTDDQQKIGGYRIEPLEVSAALACHPDVSECAVLPGRGTALVAYVVTRSRSRDPEQFRAFLHRALPAPMVPGRFVYLSELPRNQNGKLDRKLLRKSEEGSSSPTPIQAPSTELESQIARVWQEVLGRDRIGVHDSLLELGGYSLQATMIVSRLRELFQLDLPLREVFEHPTIAGLASKVARMQGMQLGDKLIRRRDPQSHARLSYAQQRLWFIEKIVPGTAAYHDVAVLDLVGDLDAGALRRSLEEVARRHEVLRTVFREAGGDVWQEAQTDQPLPFEDRDPGGSAEELERALKLHATTPFDFARGPLFRVVLFQLTPQHHVLLLVIHHLVCDGWSLNLLVREAVSFYRAIKQRTPLRHQQLEVQYADYAEWQGQYLTGSRLEELTAFWRQTLADAPVATELPLSYPRPAVESFHGASARIMLEPPLVEQLESLSRENGVTLFMTLLAAFQVLIFRHTGREDIVVGTDVANRNRKQVEPLIGFFVNELALRCDLSGNPSFRSLLGRVRETTLAAYDHQDLPFDRVVDTLQPERSLGRNPVFQIAFTLQEPPPADLGIPGLSVGYRDLELETARLDLELNLYRTPQGIEGKALYNDLLFNTASVRRFLEHYRNLLSSAVCNQDVGIGSLEMLTAAETDELVETWNQTQSAHIDSLFSQVFESTAQQYGDSPAVVESDGGTVSYTDIERRSRALANGLHALGTAHEDLVGVFARRSAGWIMAMVGIFRAGAAYLPLDTENPVLRQAQILEQSQCKIVLHDRSNREAAELAVLQLPEQVRPRLFDLETLAAQFPGTGPIHQAPSLGSLAYVIYTSGSTGAPKGAMIEHRGMINHLMAKVEDLSLTSNDRVAQTAPQSFDISIWQCLAPLIAGGSVVVYGDQIASNPRELLRRVGTDGITVLETVPSLLGLMLDEIESQLPNRPPSNRLRWMIATGELLPASHCRRWLEAYPSIPVLNAYGPTECSDDVTHLVLRHPPPVEMVSVPIGRPIRNIRIYILSPGGQLVPTGAPGEVFVGGVGVGRGYLRDPLRSAECFLPDRYSKEAGGRLYRTGDLGCHLPDGNIQFLGRVDSQVKVAGCRIDLQEIQAALDLHPEVAASVVSTWNEPGERNRLVAYVVERAIPDSRDLLQRQGERVAEWRGIYDQIYGASTSGYEPDLVTVGWNSSYTGLPIPKEEMLEWVTATVERILQYNPRRVLEIGCGTGMLLLRIAPHCERYIGTDISQPALGFVRQLLEDSEGLKERVELRLQPAEDFNGIQPGSVDIVILNSVVQYLPNLDYLRDTLAGAARILAPRGKIFVGDVRDLALLPVFHCSVQRQRRSLAITDEEMIQRIDRAIAQEQELVISPTFFASVPAAIPEITALDLQIKSGRSRNELTLFRYDVTLFVGERAAVGELITLEWRELGGNLGALVEHLRVSAADLLEIRGVPNAGLMDEVAAWHSLSEGVSPRAEEGGVDPDEVWQALKEVPYHVKMFWCPSGRRDRFAIQLKRKRFGAEAAAYPVWPHTVPSASSSGELANNPLSGKFAVTMAPKLREHLAARLPTFMVPAAFVPIQAIPLTRNGKVDFRSLPPLSHSRPLMTKLYAPPRNEREATLVGIWAELLRVERVGIHDNLFELGGDSIISIQIVARANAAGLRLTPRQAFQHQTIAELSAAAAAAEPDAEQELITGQVFLLPLQQRFLESDIADMHYWNQALALDLQKWIDPSHAELALQAVLRHHDALRTRFRRSEAGWEAWIAEPDHRTLLETIALPAEAPESVREIAEANATGMQKSFHLGNGPLLRAILFERDNADTQTLLIVAHHLIIDGVSWRVIVEDLASALRSATSGVEVILPRKTTSVRSLARRVREHAQSGVVLRSLQELREASSRVSQFLEGSDTCDGNLWGDTAAMAVNLTTAETADLLHALQTIRTSPESAILASVLRAFSESEGLNELWLEVESHGRDTGFDDIDLSRTVAWCAVANPQHLVWRPRSSFPAQVHDVAQQMSASNGFRHWDLLRHSVNDSKIRDEARAIPTPAIAFNYFGQINVPQGAGELFKASSLPKGELRSPRGRREHCIEIDAEVRDDVLSLRFVYWRQLPSATRMHHIAELALDFLRTQKATSSGKEHLILPPGWTKEDWKAAAEEVGLMEVEE